MSEEISVDDNYELNQKHIIEMLKYLNKLKKIRYEESDDPRYSPSFEICSLTDLYKLIEIYRLLEPYICKRFKQQCGYCKLDPKHFHET